MTRLVASRALASTKPNVNSLSVRLDNYHSGDCSAQRLKKVERGRKKIAPTIIYIADLSDIWVQAHTDTHTHIHTGNAVDPYDTIYVRVCRSSVTPISITQNMAALIENRLNGCVKVTKSARI